MYNNKLIFFVSALVALAQGYPGVLVTEELAPSKVADVVHAVPAAFSHQSQTVVHARSNVVSDIVAAPVEKSVDVPAEAVVTDDATVVAAASAPAVVGPVAASAAVAPVAVVAPAVVVPPSEISFHGTPLLKSLAAAASFQTYLETPAAVIH